MFFCSSSALTTKIDKTFENDILGILTENDLKSSPHLNLFWQQHKKLPKEVEVVSKI